MQSFWKSCREYRPLESKDVSHEALEKEERNPLPLAQTSPDRIPFGSLDAFVFYRIFESTVRTSNINIQKSPKYCKQKGIEGSHPIILPTLCRNRRKYLSKESYPTIFHPSPIRHSLFEQCSHGGCDIHRVNGRSWHLRCHAKQVDFEVFEVGEAKFPSFGRWRN